MRFPRVIRHRKAECKIYGKAKDYPFYRVAWRAGGVRQMKNFRTYSEAKSHADSLVKDLAKGSQTAALSAGQAADAITAIELLRGFYSDTGHNVSLKRAVGDYVEAARLLNGHTLNDAVKGYLANIVGVKRKDMAEAVEEFILADEPRTKAAEGQRAQLSSEYARIRGLRLRQFAKAFPGHAVCDVSKEHLDAFIHSLKASSAKSRNHHRAGIKQFLRWCVRKDFLAATHRLNEADSMRPEHANSGEVKFYLPKEFQALLENAEGPMRAMIAIAGLAGLRTAEVLRLTWEDVFRVVGHIEVTAGQAKTRQRRLVEVCPALAEWLEPFRMLRGKLWQLSENCFHARSAEVSEKAGVARKPNGLRHAFCSFHFALHANENLTAQQAGNSPAMIHAHYKGLATKSEAEKWFSVRSQGIAENVISLASTAND